MIVAVQAVFMLTQTLDGPSLPVFFLTEKTLHL